MNNGFYNTAFTTEEQSLINTTLVKAHKNPSYNTRPGKDTDDKVFLLSIQEVEEYFTSEGARICWQTEYAFEEHYQPWQREKYFPGTVSWWLRSPGERQDQGTWVNSNGSINDFGDLCERIPGILDDLGVSCEKYIRPAMWINLES